MPTAIPSTQAPPATTASKNTFGFANMLIEHPSAPPKSCRCELEPSFPHTPASSIRRQHQSTIDSGHDENAIMPQRVEVEDEYTLSAYGDISLGEIMVPPLPAPARPSSGLLQPRFPPQPRLRLKVRRPPMPKRRLSLAYISAPFPLGDDAGSDEHRPDSPKSTANNPSTWLQPLVSPLVDPASPRMQGTKSAKLDAPSLERLVDELLPRSPLIRLSPPGSPAASPALGPPRETHERKSGVLRQGAGPHVNDAAAERLPGQSPPAASQQNKPWRTRLPPRLPIPKWDI